MRLFPPYRGDASSTQPYLASVRTRLVGQALRVILDELADMQDAEHTVVVDAIYNVAQAVLAERSKRAHVAEGRADLAAAADVVRRSHMARLPGWIK
jgi:hypothetical protein